ncbi:MAG: glycosyltransferase family 2 protein [bacterium]
MPYFSIITPTYKRANALRRAIFSVMGQNYQDFEMIIINDSPDDESYKDIDDVFIDSRIRYIKNERNKGVNFSRNRALDLVSMESDWVIFLDDDDYFASDTLKIFSDLIKKYENDTWFMCNRATKGGVSLTSISKNDTRLNYVWNFLITKRFKGDATHCIRKDALKDIYFPKTIKQGDEWLFFYELSLHSPFFYHNFNATKTLGYETGGLNFRQRTIKKQLQTLKLLYQEGKERKIHLNPSFVIYMSMRLIRSFIKK